VVRLTEGWTRRRKLVAAVLVVSVLVGGLCARGEMPFALVGLGTAVLLAVVGLMLDAFGGIVAGFLAAAIVIAVRQAGDAWTQADFVSSLTLTMGLVFLGWLAGLAGTSLGETAMATPPQFAAVPAYGSLGLLPADQALTRLNEEIARAQRHDRPLTVVILRTDITEQGLSAGARSAAHRTVARLVESLVPDTAVPFALARDEVGAVFPETDEAAAWELLGPVMDAAGQASFTDREGDERRSLLDCAEVHAGLVLLSPANADAARLIEAARRASRAHQLSRGTEPDGETHSGPAS